MPLRYYLLLIFANSMSDTTLAFGEDLGAASQKLTDMVQRGGPDGIVSAMLVSNKKLIKVTRLYSKAWHDEQRNNILSENERKDGLLKQEKRLDIERRFSDLQAEAEENGILLPMANLVIASDDLGSDSPLTSVDMSELMHGQTATPWQDLSVDERRQRLIDEAAALGLTLAPEVPQDADKPVQPATGSQDAPAAPATASSTQPGAKKAQSAPGAKKAAQDVAKPSEGAADSDSASEGPGTSGDLLGG